jgi:hypothetical protein
MSSRDGSEETRKRLPVDEAVRLVAAAVAKRDGDEYLGPLTARQVRLIAYYVTGSTEPNSILPSHITFPGFSGRQPWANPPTDPTLTAEVEWALYQRKLYDDQCEDALDWLNDHGFDADEQFIGRERLTQEMEKAFPSRDNSKAMTASPISNRLPPPLTNEERTKIATQLVTEVAERHKKETGIVPSVKQHTTKVMGLLAQQYPQNHSQRPEVASIAKANYADDRAQPGETRARALKRIALRGRSPEG